MMQEVTLKMSIQISSLDLSKMRIAHERDILNYGS